MKTLIIEDEVMAAQSLQKLLGEVSPGVEVAAVLQSVEESVEWFEENEMPDLAFVDIHLADGSAFAIFEKVDITCPVIFTTAYDEYALKAFEVNSIAYLLKPISKKDLRVAMTKYKSVVTSRNQMLRFLTQIDANKKAYRRCFLMPERDKLVPIPVDDVAFAYIDSKALKMVTFGHKVYIMNISMDEMMEQVDPRMFYRANRQFMVARNAIKDISIWFGSKLCINLTVEVPEKIIVSKAKVSEFKQWLLS